MDIDPGDAAIGARLRHAREALGLEVREVASLLRISPSAMHDCEAGCRPITAAQLLAAARALRVSAGTLISGHPEVVLLPAHPLATELEHATASGLHTSVFTQIGAYLHHRSGDEQPETVAALGHSA